MRLALPLAAVVLLAGWIGCRSNDRPADFVARVSDTYLTEAELNRRLGEYAALRDTASARQHIIDTWITEQLLYREARRQGVASDSAVQQQLEEVRRSVLVSALIEDLKNDVPAPSETSIQTYYQRHKEQLRLREPFLRVRYASSPNAAELESMRAALTSASDSAAADSIWQRAIRTVEGAEERRHLSGNYLPLSRLRRELPADLLNLSSLDAGAISPVVENNETFHLVQVTGRMEQGTLPPLENIRGKILQQLMIQEKKLMYTREVQRLRTRARADNAIEIRN